MSIVIDETSRKSIMTIGIFDRECFMPMIDLYAREGLFADPHALAQQLAQTVKDVERVPDLALFRHNTAGFVHLLPGGHLSDVEGSDDHVRVQVLTNAGALDRDKQLEAVERLTALVAEAAGDSSIAARTWVLLTEAVEGGWGIGGHANTNEDIIALARAEIAASSPTAAN
jgi:phenylpyruvate tautomerase PptA (4-oxalocrotonate tautomerase family)